MSVADEILALDLPLPEKMKEAEAKAHWVKYAFSGPVEFEFADGSTVIRALNGLWKAWK